MNDKVLHFLAGLIIAFIVACGANYMLCDSAFGWGLGAGFLAGLLKEAFDLGKIYMKSRDWSVVLMNVKYSVADFIATACGAFAGIILLSILKNF